MGVMCGIVSQRLEERMANLTLVWMRRAGVAVLLLGVTGAWGQRPGAGPLPVIVARAEVVEDFGDGLEGLGTIRAKESVEVTANVTEFVREIRFVEGEKVAAGAILVVLDKEEEEAALKSAKALLDERMASFSRGQELAQQQAIATATLLEREALLRQIEGQIEGLEARIRDHVIRAPFDGVVGLRQVSLGALVRPGDVIATLDDLSEVKVDFDVPSVFLGDLRPGLRLTGTVDAFGAEVFTGRVETVNTRVDPVTRTVTVRGVVPNEDGRLIPGLLMSVHMTKRPRPGLLIPEGAIVQRGASKYVFVVREREGGTVAVETPVVTGTRMPGRIEVREGLQDGDLVIVHGLMQVRPGQRVEVRGVQSGEESLRSFTGDALRANNGGH